ncbi:hypothetical protein CWATWH0003_1130b2, partial [Crocosphaera watsonii WH 0003]
PEGLLICDRLNQQNSILLIYI